MGPYKNIRIDVVVTFIGGRRIEQSMVLPNFTGEPFTPLPLYRDIDPQSTELANKIIYERKKLAQYIAKQLAEAIIKSVEEQDSW